MSIRYGRSAVLFFLLVFNSGFLTIDPDNENLMPVDPPFLSISDHWVDSVFDSMTLEEKIGQLFMVAAYSNRDSVHTQQIEELIRDYKIGGLIFFQGGPVRQAVLCNHYQLLSEVPLLIGMDAEWGLGMRLDSTMSFPRHMMLGAIYDDELIYNAGECIAMQCKSMGVHINFAPVADINNNPANPVIGAQDRSFGEAKKNVARKAYFYMSGMQDNHVMAVAKHFPGHGDTDQDSHLTLPIVGHSRKRLDTLEFYPFRQLIKTGVGGIMVAHLSVPKVEKEPVASSLSHKIVTDILKESLGFRGLVFTDALNMKGVGGYTKPGEVELRAFMAGCDVLLFPCDVPAAVEQIKNAVTNGKIREKEINERCLKILKAKKWAGLNQYQPVNIENLYNNLHQPAAQLVKRTLIERALTLLRNQNDLLPLRRLDTLKIASVSIGEKEITEFQNQLGLYSEVAHFNLPMEPSLSETDELFDHLAPFNLVIVGIHKMSHSVVRRFGINEKLMDFLQELSERHKVILDIFGNPYSLAYLTEMNHIQSVMLSYEDDDLVRSLSAQAIFGGIPVCGRLPVSVSSEFYVSKGIVIPKRIRMKYTIPEEAGMDSRKLDVVDSIANNAIALRATPGCQVLVVKDTAVVFYRSYGYHTYDSLQPVRNTDLYDVASITKIVATVPSLMKLHDENRFCIDSCLMSYLSYLDTTDKGPLIIRDVLTHQSRLKDWIPFYLRTIKTDSVRNSTYSRYYSEQCPVQVAENMYIPECYRDTIYKRIMISELNKKSGYKYSDLGYYYFQQIIENATGSSLQDYTGRMFYKPLGATTLGYCPLERFSGQMIVPTENDTTFRRQLVHGYVHDYGAAMLGGVSGHAGIFSNANDLAKIMQMFLQKGQYGGDRYLSSSALELFTSCPYCPDNRRGLGFDKAEMSINRIGPTFYGVSENSFGHTGFTGTIAWADPDTGIVYIFLANRIHPDIQNEKYIEIHVRTKIMKAVYESVIVNEKKK